MCTFVVGFSSCVHSDESRVRACNVVMILLIVASKSTARRGLIECLGCRQHGFANCAVCTDLHIGDNARIAIT